MPALPKEMVPGLLATGASARMSDAVAPRFRVGDAVIARNVHPVGHTRIPRYIKGRRGVVQFDHGVFAFPDAAAHGQGHVPQHVYSVRFMARELWGPQASPLDSVRIDLFDEYMDPDPAGAAAAQEAPAAADQRPRARRSARTPSRSARKVRKPRRTGVRSQKADAEPSPRRASARPGRKAAARKSPAKKAATSRARKTAVKPARARKPAKKSPTRRT